MHDSTMDLYVGYKIFKIILHFLYQVFNSRGPDGITYNALSGSDLCKRAGLATKFVFHCSGGSDNCEECANYVRHVFSIVPGSIAVIGLVVVLMFQASPKASKQNGETRKIFERILPMRVLREKKL